MTENISFVNVETSDHRKYKFTDQERRKHCKDYQESGLSVREYSELNNISQSVLRKWMNQFNFNCVKASSIADSTSYNSKQYFEVIFPNNIRLRFPELADLNGIKRLIKEIATCN